MERWHPKLVIIGARWSSFADPAVLDAYIVEAGKAGVRVLLIEQPPILGIGDKNTTHYLGFHGIEPVGGERRYLQSAADPQYEDGQALIRRAARHPNCSILPIADIFARQDQVWVLDGRDVLYVDDDHLSHAGTLRVAPRLRREISDALAVE